VDYFPVHRRGASRVVKCSNCGAEVEFCSHCGARLPAPEAEIPPPLTLEDRLRMRLERREGAPPVEIPPAPPPELPPGPPVTLPTIPSPEAAPTPPALACSLHPAVEASAVCDLCGKPLCNECLTSYRELDLCKDDYRKLLAMQPPSLVPSRYGFSAVAAAASVSLILLSIVAARLDPRVASFVPSSGPSLFLGILSVVGILAGLALRIARRETAGALVVLLCSLVSLGVGGGFFVGAVVGVIAGLMMLLGA